MAAALIVQRIRLNLRQAEPDFDDLRHDFHHWEYHRINQSSPLHKFFSPLPSGSMSIMADIISCLLSSTTADSKDQRSNMLCLCLSYIDMHIMKSPIYNRTLEALRHNLPLLLWKASFLCSISNREDEFHEWCKQFLGIFCPRFLVYPPLLRAARQSLRAMPRDYLCLDGIFAGHVQSFTRAVETMWARYQDHRHNATLSFACSNPQVRIDQIISFQNYRGINIAVYSSVRPLKIPKTIVSRVVRAACSRDIAIPCVRDATGKARMEYCVKICSNCRKVTI